MILRVGAPILSTPQSDPAAHAAEALALSQALRTSLAQLAHKVHRT
jgi:hypothetical protein